MKLSTTIVALFLGNLVPGAQSYHNHFKRALSEALEALDLELELEYDLLDESSIHQRRAEQTITQQCLDDNVLLNEDDRSDPFAGMFETAGCLTGTMTETGMSVVQNFGDCPLIEAPYREFCEENYQYVQHRDHKMFCSVKVDNNGTVAELMIDTTVRNTKQCEPLSCPSDGNDWTSDDYNVMMQENLVGCGCGFYDVVCTHEFLEEEHGDSHDEMAMATDEVEEDHDSHDGHDHGSHDHGDSHDDEGETEATMMSGGVSAVTSSAAALMGVVVATLW